MSRSETRRRKGTVFGNRCQTVFISRGEGRGRKREGEVAGTMMSRMSRKKRREEEGGGQTLCFEYSLIRSTDGMGCLCGWRVAHPGNCSGLATDAFTRSPPCLPHAATALPRGDNRLSPPGRLRVSSRLFVAVRCVRAVSHVSPFVPICLHRRFHLCHLSACRIIRDLLFMSPCTTRPVYDRCGTKMIIQTSCPLVRVEDPREAVKEVDRHRSLGKPTRRERDECMCRSN